MRPSSSVSASARVEGSVVGEVLPSKRTICSGASPTRRAISSVDGASYDSIVPVRARTRRPYEKGSPGARRTTRDERAGATRRHAPHAPCERAHLPGLVAKRPDGAGRELRRGTDRSRARRRQDLAVCPRRRRLRRARTGLHPRRVRPAAPRRGGAPERQLRGLRRARRPRVHRRRAAPGGRDDPDRRPPELARNASSLPGDESGLGGRETAAMAKPFNGVINVDTRDSTPDWEPYLQPKAPEGAPNVLYIVLDDVGFSSMEPWGGLIETPNIKRLTAHGLPYTNWHTADLCAPTRPSLCAGRNHTTNGMAWIAEATTGFPTSHGHIPFECATIAELLGERGWNTYMLGKWHLVASDEMNMASTKRNWPVGRGFERFYGFLGGETNQWYPDLVYDNHPVEQPAMPEDGYHLTTDLTDKAIEFVKDAKAIAPEKPFFMYFCPGATHAPHHAPKEWIEKYKGRFDIGYEAYREQVFARQKQLGIFGDEAVLSPLNPYADETSVDGKPWPPLDIVRPWAELAADEQRLFARMAEVYAGFLSHTDHEIGRLLDFLEESGNFENTIIVLVSDNGASGEGGPNGSVNENKFFNGIPDDMAENLAAIDDLGSPATYNHYPVGWAWAF